MPVHYGYEVQIDNEPEKSNENEYHATGTLYSLTKALARPGKPGPEWNTMEITLDGPHTVVNVNGVKGDRLYRGTAGAAQEVQVRTNGGGAGTRAGSACRTTAIRMLFFSRKSRSAAGVVAYPPKFVPVCSVCPLSHLREPRRAQREFLFPLTGGPSLVHSDNQFEQTIQVGAELALGQLLDQLVIGFCFAVSSPRVIDPVIFPCVCHMSPDRRASEKPCSVPKESPI